MELKNISLKDINEIDRQFAFFHYTSIENIRSIEKLGLLPQIGNSAIGIEKTEKIFFAIGEKGVFSIFDSWIRWLIAKRLTDLPGEKLDLPFYRLCIFMMKLPILHYIIGYIADFIVYLEFKSKRIKIKSFKIMKEILDGSCFLLLDLKEHIDFSYTDTDEVKSQKFNQKLLKRLYAKERKMNSKKMDYWNMHTFSNVKIDPSKITLLKKDDSYKCIDLLVWMVRNTKIDLKKRAPFLYEFLTYYELI